MTTPAPLPLPLQDMVTEGEHILAHWRPSGAQFLKGFLISGGITALFLGPLTFDKGVIAFTLSLILGVAIWGVVFDDLLAWRLRRADHWVLTDRQLLFCNTLGDGDPASVPLSAITGFAGFGWLGLTLRLEGGMRQRIAYLADPRKARRQIEAAQASLT